LNENDLLDGTETDFDDVDDRDAAAVEMVDDAALVPSVVAETGAEYGRPLPSVIVARTVA
jgi:hypothetical protein